MQNQISRQMLGRLPLYVNYLKSLPVEIATVSATNIAQGLGLNDVQVRKDLAAISSGGRPKVGYITKNLTRDIQSFLGYGAQDKVVIIGMGHLGRALAHYKGFLEYGQEIVAVFDRDPEVAGNRYMGMEIQHISKLPELCGRLRVNIGIITVPSGSAQEACGLLVDCGVKIIWNFAPVYLSVPEGVFVQNENMAVSLALLSRRVGERRQGTWLNA